MAWPCRDSPFRWYSATSTAMTPTAAAETGRERGVSAEGFPQGRQHCWAVWPVKEKPDPWIYYKQFLDF